MSALLIATPRRVFFLRGGLLAAGAALSLWLAFSAGRATAPAPEGRRDCLEVRLASPEDGGKGLIVRAMLYDGAGAEVWRRELPESAPIGALFDGSAEGQQAVDLSHWHAEQEIEDGTK